ncbi:PRC-barrel domain-containing protein [Pseudocolwellia sp. HL-MZ7]|uniref:PRC-barrel domain-containing protein n=1 Tax=Pseudocolwellia sp. HL-MZ7 TaxID=3400627 RepID=UPI003CF070B3
MLRTIESLAGYSIQATDGNIGHITDVYFDDNTWCARYLVVDTGTWLSSRKVLISPISINKANWEDKLLSVSITKDQVKNSPNINTQKPLCRQQEVQLLEYYGYPYYWGGDGMWGSGLYPHMMLTDYNGLISPSDDEDSEPQESTKAEQIKDDDVHLRSCQVITGYQIHATDGDIGHIQGFLIDEDTWVIRYMIVNTSNWWLGHQVLIPPYWIDDVSWTDAKGLLNLTRQAVKDAPPYNSNMQMDRKAEMYIYNHYGRPVYWMDENIKP